MERVPLIPISSLEDEETVRRIGLACKDWGFFYISDHGVAQSLISRVLTLGTQFFQLGAEEKRRVARREDNFQGYSDAELTKRKLDWKEVFDFTPVLPPGDDDPQHEVHGCNQWPEAPLGFQAAMEEYLGEMQALARRLMVAILRSLGGGSEVEQFVSSSLSHETSVCRLNYYPVCPEGRKGEQLGVGPHSDPAILTILLQDDKVCSLQVEREGVWYDIPPIPETFVVNIGDMMQVWSNGLYKGPVHRVLANHEAARFSVPFFLAPSYSVVVSPLQGSPKKYRDIPWGEFRRRRYEGDYADKGEEIQISHYEITQN